MREIKFRYWDDLNNKMVYDVERSGQFGFYLKNYECMQFIGTKDLNGKEIYEGDILTWKWNGMRREYFLFENIFSALKYELKNCKKGLEFPSIAEVVGNIYENPNLLKKKFINY